MFVAGMNLMHDVSPQGVSLFVGRFVFQSLDSLWEQPFALLYSFIALGPTGTGSKQLPKTA